MSFSDGTVSVDGGPVINNAPDGATLATAVIAENAVAGTIVGTVVGSDPDAGDTLTYGLVDDAGGRFAIDATTGALTVAGGAAIDYEAAISHGILVSVTDAAGASANFALTIDVINVADVAPRVHINTGLQHRRKQHHGYRQRRRHRSRMGSAASATASAAAPMRRCSNIDAARPARCAFLAAPNFELPQDAGGDNVYDLVVTASDGTASSDQAIAVTVTDVVEAPTMTYTGTNLADVFTVPDGAGWTMSGLTATTA